MNKKKILLISSISILTLSSLILIINNNDKYSFASSGNIANDSCVTPSGYNELYDVIESANKEMGLTLNVKANGSTSYNTFGTVTRINKGSDKQDIYIERIDPNNRVRSGLYIYGSDVTNYKVGNIIGVTGKFTNYYGLVELIPTETELLAETNSYGEVVSTVISVNSLHNDFSYLNQATRIKLENIFITSTSYNNVTNNNSSAYLTAKDSSDNPFGIKINTRNSATTNDIADKLIEYANKKTKLNLIGNICYHSGTYKIDIGSINDISLSSGDIHSHTPSNNYYSDTNYHWQICTTCNEIINKANHISGDWIITDNYKYKKCTICEKELEREIISVNNKVTIDIYAFNDTHGAVNDSDTASGIAKTATYIKNQKKNNPNMITLSSGDMYQGSMESNNTKGKLMTEWMNELEFSSMTLGNHEFDWYDTAIKENEEIANFPILGINVFDNSTSKRVSYAKASTTVTIDGIKFGIIGAIGNCKSSISGSRVKDVDFKVGSALTTLVKEEATRLRQEEKCNFIIYSLHSDSSDYDTSLSNGYIDMVFEGHTHKEYISSDTYGIYHFQGSGYNQSFSHASIEVDKSNMTFTYNEKESIQTTSFSNLEDDQDTLNLIDKYSDMIGNPNEVVGYNSTKRDASYLKTLISKLYLEAEIKEWGNKYDICLGGGYISCRSPYYLPAGNVTISTIYNLFPFDNDITLCSGNGTFINKCYVNTTNSNYFTTYNTDKGYSSSYSYSANKTYYLVCDTYGSDYYIYGNGARSTYNFKQLEISTSGKYARDLLIEYISNGNLK